MSQQQCQGRTRRGERCRNVSGFPFCRLHIQTQPTPSRIIELTEAYIPPVYRSSCGYIYQVPDGYTMFSHLGTTMYFFRPSDNTEGIQVYNIGPRTQNIMIDNRGNIEELTSHHEYNEIVERIQVMERRMFNDTYLHIDFPPSRRANQQEVPRAFRDNELLTSEEMNVITQERDTKTIEQCGICYEENKKGVDMRCCGGKQSICEECIKGHTQGNLAKKVNCPFCRTITNFYHLFEKLSSK